jgi:RNA polymerase sigma-70 factor (ECF subfamily)
MGIVSRGHSKLQRSAADQKATQQADEEQVRSLYQENMSLIYRYVSSWVSNKEEAEDLTSEIFLKAVQKVDYRRSSQEIRTWLYQVARTTLVDHWRHRYRVHIFSLEQYLDEGDDEELDVCPSRWAKRKDSLSESLSTCTLERCLEEEHEEPVNDELVASHSQRADEVDRLLESLPEHYRDVLTCRYLLDLSIKDTACRMGVTEANVKVLQFRALRRAAALAHVLTG